MSYLEEVLQQICQELNKPYSNVEKFKTILENEWIDSREALNATQINELVKLGIPQMLAKKLKERASNAHPKQGNPGTFQSLSYSPYAPFRGHFEPLH